MPDTPVTPTPTDDSLTQTNRIVHDDTCESTVPFFQAVKEPGDPVDALPQEALFERAVPGTDTCLDPHLPPVYGFTTSPSLATAVRRRRRWPWLVAGVMTTVSALVAAWLLSQTEVLLKRSYRTASRSNARRALRLLGCETLGRLRKHAQLQLQRCEVALKR